MPKKLLIIDASFWPHWSYIGIIFRTRIIFTWTKNYYRSKIPGHWGHSTRCNSQISREYYFCFYHYNWAHDRSYIFILSSSLLGRFILIWEKRDIIILSLSIGSLFHLVEDQLWRVPQILFWPLKGLSFPKDTIDYVGIEQLSTLFKKCFILNFSHSSIPEIFGLGVIAILTLHWLIKRLGQNKFWHQSDKL